MTNRAKQYIGRAFRPKRGQKAGLRFRVTDYRVATPGDLYWFTDGRTVLCCRRPHSGLKKRYIVEAA